MDIKDIQQEKQSLIELKNQKQNVIYSTQQLQTNQSKTDDQKPNIQNVQNIQIIQKTVQQTLRLLCQKYINRFCYPEISFNYGKKFYIKIKTQRLILSSIQKDDYFLIHKYLWSQQNVMKLFATGATKTLQQTKNRVNGWVERWTNQIPFSAMSVKLKSDNSFLGYIVMGYGSEVNSSQVAYLIREDFWNQGYGYQILGATTLFLSQLLQKNGYKVNSQKENFQRIVATSNILNIASQKILQKSGFRIYNKTQKFGHQRYEYQLILSKNHNRKDE